MTGVRRRLVGTVVIAGCVLALAGCTDSNDGTPTPTMSPSVTSSGSPAPTVEIPARPEELRVDGVEACSLITQGQPLYATNCVAFSWHRCLYRVDDGVATELECEYFATE